MSRHVNKSPREFRALVDKWLAAEATRRGWDVQRVRRRLAFERFMVRVQREFGEGVTLKGGVALELRLDGARATTDLDLHIRGTPAESLLERLRRSGNIQLADRLSFEIKERKHGVIQSDALEYGGVRYLVECNLSGKLFDSFTLDASFAEEMFDDPEEREGMELLAELEIERPKLRIYPLTTHIAEKLHAYTAPQREATRVKDLPDLALLMGEAEGLDAAKLRDVIARKFARREQNARASSGDDGYSHPVPAHLPAPPSAWEAPYAALSAASGLEWSTLAACYEAAQRFLDPMLGGCEGRWSVDGEVWG